MSSQSWNEDIFDNFIRLNRGFDLPDRDVVLGDYPVAASSSIKTYHHKYKAKGPGVTTGRSGSLGVVQYIANEFWPLNTTLYVKDYKGNYPKYVFYFLQLMHLENFNSGAGVPTLNQNHLHKLKIKIPPVQEQKKIAAVLSAYDDLIENNKRRIALLEKMAEEIYREWFVRLRFPGHDKVKLVKGVPEGWDKVPLEKAFTYSGGGTPSKEVVRYWKHGEINWYTPSDITAALGLFLSRSADQCTEEGLNSSSARMFPPYSVMMTSRATIGAIGINTTPACTNQGFITCIPNDRYPLTFLFHWLKLAKPHFELLSGGATFAELTKGTFKRIEILTPTMPLVEKFEGLVRPMFDQMEMILKQVDRLTRTRDRLLPRLVSGKLSVETLDIQFPPSMQDEPTN